MAHHNFDRPLEGVRVLDLSRLLPGPFCSLLLADMGADVVKVEAPESGDYARWMGPDIGEFGAFFAAVNRNKRSIALDLKHPDAVAAFLTLVQDAEVVLETFRPGVMARLGLNYEVLRDVNPKLVMCAISGYGQDGPLALRAGHDLNYLALAGLLDQSGPVEGPLMPPGFQLADIAGGALYALAAINAALLQAQRTGDGAYLDIAMCEGALSFHLPLHAQRHAGHVPVRGGDTLNGGFACYNVYATKDQRFLSVGSLEPKFWMAFLQVIGLPELMGDGHTAKPSGREAAAKVAKKIASEDLATWQARFAEVDACVEPVLTLPEVAAHPHFSARNLFFTITDGAQRYPQMATPLSGPSVRQHSTRPPKLGEHGAQLLAQAGYDADAIAALRASGALGDVS